MLGILLFLLICVVYTRDISGYFHITNFHEHDGIVEFDYEFEFQLKVSVLGHHETLKMSHSGHFKKNLGNACYTVYSIAVGSVKLCLDVPNKKVCAEACLGKWGVEKCAKYCVPF